MQQLFFEFLSDWVIQLVSQRQPSQKSMKDSASQRAQHFEIQDSIVYHCVHAAGRSPYYDVFGTVTGFFLSGHALQGMCSAGLQQPSQSANLR